MENVLKIEKRNVKITRMSEKENIHFFYAPRKRKQRKNDCCVFLPFHAVPFPFFHIEFYFKIYFSVFRFTSHTVSISRYVFCKYTFNVFNFFTSHSVAKKQCEQPTQWANIPRLYTRQESTYIYVCFFRVACSIVVTPFFLHLKVLYCIV